MTHRNDAARGADVLGRWRMLAEQRLEHLTELFESGRWRRYHSEKAFLENIKEAKNAVEIWRGLSTRQGRSAKAGRGRAVDPDSRARAGAGDRAGTDQDAPRPRKSLSRRRMRCTVAPIIDMLALEQALDVPELTIELAAIEQRYPLFATRCS